MKAITSHSQGLPVVLGFLRVFGFLVQWLGCVMVGGPTGKLFLGQASIVAIPEGEFCYYFSVCFRSLRRAVTLSIL